MKWEKICASDMTDKVLIPKIYKQLIQLNNYFKIIGKRPKQTFLQRRHTDGQQAHEKMLNITNHQGNANQNQNEISPHTCQNVYHQQDKKEQDKKCW